MTLLDGLILAVRSTLRRPGRAALTILAVTLGSGLLVALETISTTADSRVVSQLSKGGPLAAIKVVANQAQPGQLDSDTIQAGAAKPIDDTTLATLRRAPGVTGVTPVLGVPALVVPPRPAGGDPNGGNRSPFFGTMVGTDLGAANQLPITVLAGRLPASLTEVGVTQSYLDHIHVQREQAASVLGTEVEIAEPRGESGGEVRVRGRWIRAVIVGVVAQSVSDGDVLVPLEQTRLARQWALTGVAIDKVPLPVSAYSGALVTSDNLADVSTVRAEITTLGFASSAPEHLIASVQKYLHVVDIVLGGIGLVALVIAALGIANALVSAMRERRREIGVLKAIGARDADVLRWFLFEAVLVGLVGGALGSVVGIGVASAVGIAVNGYLVEQGLEGVSLGAPDPIVLALGIGGAAVLAVLAGAIPALRASRLPAREAVGGS